ncbi:MAG TPA: hypothetical protein PKH58_01515 [Paludibacteraceae bacterium]|nr:hypothetical protein [Paludibacteraceae bacterium]
MFSEHTKHIQMATLPAGYEIVTTGNIQPGDIRWNAWEDCWNIDNPVSAEKHKLIINDPVSNFHGVCRKSFQVTDSQLPENRVKENEPDVRTEYVNLEWFYECR